MQIPPRIANQRRQLDQAQKTEISRLNLARSRIAERLRSVLATAKAAHIAAEKDKAKQEREAAKAAKKTAAEIEARALWVESPYSITLSYGRGDVPLLVFDLFWSEFLSRCSWGGQAYERGGVLGHWHIQATAIVRAKGANNARNQILIALGWAKPEDRPKHFILCVKKLTGTKLHTEEGMFGYILKDAPKSQADGFVSVDSQWQYKLKNVTAAQITKGIELNAMFGAGEFKNQVFLTRHNLMERCSMFVRMHEKGIALRRFSDVLASMIHTGSYHLATEFGMAGVKFDRQKTEIMFRMRMVPLSVDVADVETVVFGGDRMGGLGSGRRVGPLVGASLEECEPLRLH